MNGNGDSFLTYREAACLLRISPLTLRKKVSMKQVPVLKPFGKRGKCLFSEQDLRAMLERSRVPALAEQGKKGAGRAAVV